MRTALKARLPAELIDLVFSDLQPEDWENLGEEGKRDLRSMQCCVSCLAPRRYLTPFPRFCSHNQPRSRYLSSRTSTLSSSRGSIATTGIRSYTLRSVVFPRRYVEHRLANTSRIDQWNHTR